MFALGEKGEGGVKKCPISSLKESFCDWLDYHAGSYATCVRICNKNNELLDFFVINSFYTGEIPFFYCYDKNGNRVSNDVMRNRLIKYAKKNRFDCGSL